MEGEEEEEEHEGRRGGDYELETIHELCVSVARRITVLRCNTVQER